MHTNVDLVFTVIILFLLGLISPGPNFLVVAQSTLNWGRFAGFVTGLGAAAGDALYATCGLFGVAQLIQRSGRLMIAIKLIGGLYLACLGARMLLRRADQGSQPVGSSSHTEPLLQHFCRGLLTDLANPKTIVFFASIFAVTVQASTPHVVRFAMLAGIVLTSIAWRSLLSIAFSTSAIRRAYQRSQRAVERVFGAALCLFGIHLVKRAAQ